jgi:PAS domain S-box-containing protein
MPLRSSIKGPETPDKHTLYKELLNNLPAAIYLCDADGYVTSYNDAAARLWGREPEIGKDLWCGSWKIFDLEGNPIPLASCPMAMALKTRKPVRGREIIIEQPDGARYNVLPHPQPLFNDKGELVGAINMLVDVTTQSRYRELQRRTEQLETLAAALKESEERYHGMVAEVEDYAIILLSKEGLIQNWNKGAEKIKGYSEQEIVGQHFRKFYLPEDQKSQLPERLIRIAEVNGKAGSEGWRVKKDGSRFWGSISITAIHDSSGRVVGFVKVTRDLTERHNQELTIQKINEDLKEKNALLKESEERYHRMVAEVEDYVIIFLDPQGYIINWNKGAQKIKGYTADEIVGKHFSVFYTEADRKKGLHEQILKEALMNGKAVHEGWRQRKDKTTFWGSVVMTAIRDSSGQFIGYSKVTRDLTERKIAEERLLASSEALHWKNKELQRMNEELSSFAYISSHDLQEPLRKIQTFADRIVELEHDNLSEKGKDYFRRMQAGAARMQRLIRDILAYSRASTLDKTFEVTDLNELLKQSQSELEELVLKKNAVIESDRLPTISVIPFQIQQLFNNILSNAIKFTRAGVVPRVVIRSEIVKGKQIDENAATADQDYCHLSFSDNGIGFEPEYSKKIFEVFQRLHGRSEYDGTGIGLAICKKIAENHDGFMSAESTLGTGSTFHLYLPLNH